MESLRKKAGYLEGLLKAMNLPEDDTNAQLTRGIVELLSEMSDRVETMDDMMAELNDYVESIDDDLSDLEGIHDDEDMDGDVDEADFSDGKIKLMKTEPTKIRVVEAVKCPECGGVFMIENGAERYICPICQKSVVPVDITEANTPMGEADE